MSQELKTVTVNLKSLDQDIKDPIVAGGADVNGRTFRIIFDQEAAAQITPETKVYLSWFHRQKKIKGYNVFTQTNDDPIIWEIKWPQAMLLEGDVLCCIELVDSVSIAQSTNFIVHVLSDPNDGSSFVVSDDFTLFQNAVIRLNCIGDQMKKQMVAQKIEFEDMLLEFSKVKVDAKEAVDTANAATTNGNTHINVTDDNTFRSGVVIKGTGATSVTSDASGNITVHSTDTDTWRPIQNNLTSTATDQSLSAAQSKVLNDKFSSYVPTSRTVNNKALSSNIALSASDVGAAPTNHIHDDRYYTESEIDTKLNAKAANDIIIISSTQPTSDTCKIWFKI